MSVYVVNVKEPCNGNKTLCETARVFKGNIFYRDTTYGSFMVHEEQGVTPDQQRDSIRSYFAAKAMPVIENANDTGHVIFEVDLTPLARAQTVEVEVGSKPEAHVMEPKSLALAA